MAHLFRVSSLEGVCILSLLLSFFACLLTSCADGIFFYKVTVPPTDQGQGQGQGSGSASSVSVNKGAFDTSFNSMGYLTTSVQGSSLFPAQVMGGCFGRNNDIYGLQIVYNYKNYSFDMGVVKTNETGVDSSFGNHGSLVINVSDRGGSAGSGDWVTDCLVQPDGKLVVSGFLTGGTIVVLRLNPDGRFDGSFGINGKTFVSPFSGSGTMSAPYLAQQSDGKFVLGGGVNNHFWLSRLNPDGSLDTAFGNNGKVQSSFGNDRDNITSVVIQTDGKIVAGGRTSNNTDLLSDFAVARYHPNGSLDTTFNGNGKLTMDLNFYSSTLIELLVLPTGKMLLVGSVEHSAGTGDIALVRLNPDGSPDAGFGSKGLVLTDFGSDRERAMSVAIGSVGKEYFVGLTTGGKAALASYHENGALNTGFGTAGLFNTGLSSDAGMYISIYKDSKNRIVTVGPGGLRFVEGKHIFDMIFSRHLL